MVLMTEEEREAHKRELLEKASNFTYFKDRKDDFRAETASSAGGFELRDADLTYLLRSAGTELIGMVGRKILSGDFNLTRISFPIRCMSP